MSTYTQPERLRCEVCDMPTLGDTLCNLHYEEQEKITHTPGPWIQDNMETCELEFNILSAEKRLVAIVPCATTFQGDVEMAHSDAHVIAAAPAMLEALKLAQFALLSMSDDVKAHLPGNVLPAMREAIRLAEGRS